MNARGAAVRGLFWAAVLLVGTVRVAWAQAPPEAIEYYARDAVGSVRIVFDAQGNVLGRSDYLPFGETWNQSGALPRQRFTGQARDGEAGLDDFNARAYQPLFGRFTRPDPVSGNLFAPQSWNAYAYVQNRPLVLVDPSGMTGEGQRDSQPLDIGLQVYVSVSASGLSTNPPRPTAPPLPPMFGGISPSDLMPRIGPPGRQGPGGPGGGPKTLPNQAQTAQATGANDTGPSTAGSTPTNSSTGTGTAIESGPPLPLLKDTSFKWLPSGAEFRSLTTFVGGSFGFMGGSGGEGTGGYYRNYDEHGAFTSVGVGYGWNVGVGVSAGFVVGGVNTFFGPMNELTIGSPAGSISVYFNGDGLKGLGLTVGPALPWGAASVSGSVTMPVVSVRRRR